MLQPLQKMEAYTRFYPEDMTAEIPGRSDLAQAQSLIASDRSLPRLLKAGAAQKGFYQELWGSIERNSTCAWLEQGLYVAADGTACSCCFIKDNARDGLGMLAGAPVEDVLRKRGELQRLLRAGDIPGQCQGCGIALALTKPARQQSC